MLTCSQTLLTLLQLFEESKIPGNFRRHCERKICLDSTRQSTAAVAGKVLVKAKKKKRAVDAVKWKRGTDALYPTYLLQNGPPPSRHVMITIT